MNPDYWLIPDWDQLGPLQILLLFGAGWIVVFYTGLFLMGLGAEIQAVILGQQSLSDFLSTLGVVILGYGSSLLLPAVILYLAVKLGDASKSRKGLRTFAMICLLVPTAGLGLAQLLGMHNGLFGHQFLGRNLEGFGLMTTGALLVAILFGLMVQSGLSGD